MAISPPSDLVLDVVRAADPASVRAAADRLASGAPARTSQSEKTAASGFDRARQAISAKTSETSVEAAPQAYRKFEAMVLQSFVKSMLPKESEDVYGKGMAGDIWKGMMAEQIADVVAERGGIGIADRLLAGGEGAGSLPRASMSGDNGNLATSLVHRLQMSAFDAVGTPGSLTSKQGGSDT